MSHSRLRKEPNCLNCDTEVVGRYCHVCGQENIDPRESFLGLVTHFFNDITHFDGKFFTTVGTLIKRPGHLAYEYMQGKRAGYLHPIRMYIFTSALFFLVFYSYTDNSLIDVTTNTTPATGFPIERDTLDLDAVDPKYTTVGTYDSIQAALPKAERDNWLKRMVTRRGITMKNRYSKNLEGFAKDFGYQLLHSLPSLLFVSLPFFALILKLLYARRNYVYADHAIFLVFLYIFMFILFLVLILLDITFRYFDITIWPLLLSAAIIYATFYTLYSMRRFYRQRRLKTVLKYVVFNVLATFVILVLFIVFLLLTFFRV